MQRALIVAAILWMGWQPRVIAPEDQLRMEIGKLNANVITMNKTLVGMNANLVTMNKRLASMQKSLDANTKEVKFLNKLMEGEIEESKPRR